LYINILINMKFEKKGALPSAPANRL